jgi:hypothetical protein
MLSMGLQSAPSEEDHDPNELEWEASLRRHMGTFTQFDSIDSTQRVQWAKDHLSKELNMHERKRAQLEEDRKKLAKEEEEMKVRHLLELRKAIVRAWMRIEEREWQKIREQWKEEASTLEEEFEDELKQLQAITSPVHNSINTRWPTVPTTNPGPVAIVGFGLYGVAILPNVLNVLSISVVKNFGQNAGGWLTSKHPRLVADVTGDKSGDIVGFGKAGVWISINNGNNTFADPPKMVIADFAYSAGGWRIDKHIRYMADIRNVGRADIIGFGDAGVLISRNKGGLNFGPATLALNDFGYNAGGWRLDRHLRFLADVTGDGRLDIVGFGENHVFIARNNGNGTFSPAQAVIDNFCAGAGGWKVGVPPRFVADLTGDGRADIIGCGEAGCWASLNDGSGAFGLVNLVIKEFGAAQGWRVDKHPRFIADLTGDKRGDVIGFAEAGVHVAMNNGDGTFQPMKCVLNDFCVQQGWMVSKHPRFVVDLTGDGCVDIIGFGEKSTFVSLNDRKGNFGPVKALTNEFSFSGGKWAVDKTVRLMANLD